MENIRLTFLFGWPYMRKYFGRLIIGLMFGVFFGLFNASFVWGTKTLFERLEPKTEATADLNQTNALSGVWKSKLDEANRVIMSRLNDWLPQIGSQLEIRQVIGGLFFLPILVGLRSGLGYASVYFLGWVSEHAVRDIRMDAHEKLQSLSMDYFNSRQLGDHTMLMNRSTESLHRCLTYGVADAIKEPFTILGLVVAMFILDWQLALFGIVFAPLSVIPIVIVGRKLRRVAKVAYDKGTEQDSLMVEVYSNMRTIKAYCLERTQRSRFGEIYEKLVRMGMKSLQARHLQNPVIELLSVFGAGVIIIFVFHTGKSVPELVGFLTGMIMLYQPIKKLGGINQYYQEASVGVGMLRGVFDQVPSVQERKNPNELKSFQGRLQFEGVEFSYGDEVVLREFDLAVGKGMKLGVVGESGAGKSTVVSLLLRFYDPTKGRVTIDGADIRGVTFESLRGQMALVSQEVVIFDQTVAENIACGKLDASLEEIVAAAKAANAHEFIEGLPEGYDTRLGEQGTRLSGGQRQRIAIARAFVRQAPILILDEATAALDSKAEAEVQGAINRLEEGRTVVCVAHRLSTLRGMDKIIVLEEGRVLEEGGFAELLERDGVFAEMARKQGLAAG
jgi:ABC-type multidrug transport system fused ATPase/permease subunit